MSIDAKNMMEDFVQMHLNAVLKQVPDMCKCEQCMADAKALALNNLPSRYVTSHKGNVFVRVQSSTDTEVLNILREVTMAVEKVAANPHHSK